MGSNETVSREPRYPVDTVHNALRLLELLGSAREVRVSSIAEALGVAVSTAHRLLSQMEHDKFVSQDSVSRLYRAGPALVKLSTDLAPSEPMGYAGTVLRELATRLGETVSLQVLRGSDVLFLSSCEAPQLLRVSSRAGAVLPAHCVSGGKALLALLTQEEILKRFPTEKLEALTGSSIVLRTDLLRELEVVRERGYAMNFGESEVGVSGVAVAVPVPNIAPRALAVAAPRARLSKRRVSVIVQALAESAPLIAEELSVAGDRIP